MRIGVSLFLIALGAVLAFAVDVKNTHGFNVNAAGVILMIIGAVGLLITGIWMTSRRRTDVYTHGAAAYGPTYGAPVVGQPVVGQPVVGQPVVGQPVVGQPVVAPRRQTIVEPNDPFVGPY